MSYFRKLDDEMGRLMGQLEKSQSWLVMINADPDALASAIALRRIIRRRVAHVDIVRINEITRPDNLAMIHFLHIKNRKYRERLAEKYDKYAIVDSQPHHDPIFSRYDFSIVVDHHPAKAIPENRKKPGFMEIRPEYGACSTLFVEYLYNLKIKPSRQLATALFYGIKADTMSFERDFCDADIKAFRYLSKFADQNIIRKIVRNEFPLAWTAYYKKAFDSITQLNGGAFIWMDKVESPDVLVILADFFMRVQEVGWCVVSGRTGRKVVSIFRGDGIRRDVGKLAIYCLGQLGGAGGHRTAARSEIEIKAFKGKQPRETIWERLCERAMRTCQAPSAPTPAAADSAATTPNSTPTINANQE